MKLLDADGNPAGVARVEWAGEAFELLPQRAAYWRARRALLIADPHFGKADHFRAAGIPAPDTVPATLNRLSAALDTTAAEELLILGDFFHARGGVLPDMLDLLRNWRDARPRLRITMVSGNHDRHAGPPPAFLDVACVGEELAVGSLVLRHHPDPVPGRFVVAGHVHPAVRLRSAMGHGLRAACFHVGPRVMTLPAFGDFTGTHVIRPRVGDRVFALGPGRVVEVTPRPRAL